MARSNSKTAAVNARRFEVDFVAVSGVCQKLARMRQDALREGSLVKLNLVDQLQSVADAQELRLIELAQQ